MTSNSADIAREAGAFAGNAQALADQAKSLAGKLQNLGEPAAQIVGVDPFIAGLTVFILACFVGYYVVWKVTPALHSPLMGVTNAISSVIIVGALLAAGPADLDFASFMGFIAVILASVNIFGGFIVTQRMLSMFKKKAK